MSIRENLVASAARLLLEQRKARARLRPVWGRLTRDEQREADARALDAFGEWLRQPDDDDT